MSRPLYPALLASYYVLFLWFRNIEEISIGEGAAVLAGSVVLALGLQLALARVTRDGHAGSAVAAVWVAVCLGYGHLYSLVSQHAWGRHRYLLGATALLVFAAFLIARRGWIGPGFSAGANWVAILLVLASLLGLGPVLGRPVVAPPGLDPSLLAQARDASDDESLPDVYLLILDGYGRGDVLSALYDFDNSEFLTDLESLGFAPNSGSFANYPTTLTSLASFLNLDYLRGDGELREGLDRLQPLYDAIRSSRLLRLFEAAGYRSTVISAHRYAKHRSLIAHTVEQCGPSWPFVDAWLATTILRVEPRLMTMLTLDKERGRVLCQFSALEAAVDQAGPKLVLFHVISPHPPFLFRSDGTESGLVETNLVDWMPREAYTAQLEFVNRKTRRVLTKLALRRERPSITVLLADHGPASLMSPGWSLGAAAVRERSPILLAVHDSRGTVATEDVPLSPISATRWLVNSALGLSLPYLEDRAFFSDRESPPLVFVDVTELAGGVH